MKDKFGKDLASLKEKKLWLFDMDGTIYLGNKLFDGALELFSNIKKNGGKYVFVTNNSSKGIKKYLKKIKSMGIDALNDNLYTSVDATYSLLNGMFSKNLIYAQGSKDCIKTLKEYGLNITEKYNENAKCILVGFDTDLTFKKLETTSKMLNLDIPYYATNPDWSCPTEYGYVPDCGSMCFGLEKATGKKPIFIGKPNSLMIEEAIKKEKVTKAQTVIIGDRIYTDIASGENAKVDTILVLSGETSLEDAKKSDIKPKYTIDTIKDLNAIF